MIDWTWTEVDKLEKQEKWNEAKAYLLNSWRQNPADLKTVIRLGFFCWYVVVEQGPLGIADADVDMDELETLLEEVTHFGLTHFMTNEDFLWCFGYMISMFPYYFGDYEQWEEKGISMLKRASELRPDEPIYTYSYLRSFSNTYDKHKEVFQQVQIVLEDRFKGEGLLSDYFKNAFN
ncbi:hypothetical protein BLD48_06965 [Exiguobacterium sp. KRL4]|uniref:hypothetical protein n=1 Tax=Exiguobacterium sp. KRL4 TaxID=1914536 RepID=UPI0008F942A5|nr:hypothetical protein [Exiguobacterium sp. KRL4]OIN67358.1 hypothetical protein BLD48_06965 [Exiguobacterium sp. KRL4]